MCRSREGGDSAKHLVPTPGRLLMLLPGAHGSTVAKQLGVGTRVPLSGPGAGGQEGERVRTSCLIKVLLQLHSRDDSFFYLFLPSGIRGVMEIIYHLMWADGLIKLTQKATTVAVSV